jgi:hypothetical protein
MNNINKWDNDYLRVITVSSIRPEGPGWYPVVSLSRVRGSSYTPYVSGSVEWRDAANRLLADFARANFERNGR